MNNSGVFKLSALAGAIAMVTACGGGDSGSAGAGDTSVGVITGFGSIYVNGVKFDTSKVSHKIDGKDALETELSVGDVVTITGTINADGVTGTATAVSSDDELEGYVLDVSGLGIDGTGEMNVMGQRVIITADTRFEGNETTILAITDLAANDIVEVHGFSDGAGLVTATRIETKDSDEDVEVKGLVNSLNTVAMTFKLGELTVDYSTAGEIPENLADDLYVEAKTTQPLSGTTMIASKVEIEDDGDKGIDGDEGEEIEVQGMVSDITETSFRFNGTLVEFASLEIDDDFNLATLTEGMMITVEGYIDANGNFVVEEIEDEHESEDEVQGYVTFKTETSVTINDGVEDMTFIITNETRMIDEQDSTKLHYFSLADLNTGEYAEIEYYIDEANGNAKVATELEREDAPL